jgi:hypothetical protein
MQQPDAPVLDRTEPAPPSLPRRDAILLRVFAGWTLFVWGVLIRNMLKDSTHTVGFRVVHIGLAVISITLAVATWAITMRVRAGRRSAP